ncbi:MAG: AraC family transcriptional regulator [Eubacteriales bacterium]|nr:AraC family transcriptional regulator [Eubacteriales bacterium]
MMFTVNYCDSNRHNVDKDQIIRPYGSGDYLFLYFMTKMKVTFGETIVTALPNSFLLFPKDAPQIYEAENKFQNGFIHFSVKDPGFTDHYRIPVNQIVYLPNPQSIADLLRDIHMEYNAKQEFYEERIDYLMHLLFIHFSRQLTTQTAYSGWNQELYEVFRDARTEILTHIDREWTSESMAALTHLGISQFYHYYQEFFSISPKAELLDARIERAKYMLRVDHAPVGYVAISAGFQSFSNFTRYFKKHCGMTPSEYASQYA